MQSRKGEKLMVEAFKVTGGKEISGILEVEGAKNAALPIMIATLIEKGTYILKNVPNLMDIRTLAVSYTHLRAHETVY